jgi:glycosidase
MNKLFILFLVFFIALSCKKTDNTPALQPSISSLGCTSAAVSATPVVGQSYTGTITVPYSGGNGASYAGGSSVASTGVTGLTATLQPGTMATGSGNITYTVTGTPASNGTARFNITFGGVSCSVDLRVEDQPFVQYGVPFANVPDRQDATIYQVNIRAFSSQGNLQGVIARLDSIKALGANVIYLMPIHPIGSVNSINSPYSIRDFRSVNPEFGSLADLRALVDGAHSRNMSVIMDWVANHTSWDNPWISAHRDWYLQGPTGNILSPPGTGWNDVAQLNFSNAAMRQEMIKNMKYWVYTANVDGFRCDYADGPPDDFWRQAVDSLRKITTHKLLLLAEGSRTTLYTAGFDFIFGFNFYGQLKNVFNGQSPTSLDQLNSSEYVNATAGQQVVRYITNHDVNSSDGTPQELYGGIRGSIAAFVIVAYMRSVPMVYSGQEVATPFRLTFPFTSADIDWTLNPNVTAEYKRIIAFRNASAAIRRGQPISYSTSAVCAFTKEQGTERVFVAVNVTNTTVTYTLPATVANSNWTNAMTGNSTFVSTTVTLEPHGYLVLRK